MRFFPSAARHRMTLACVGLVSVVTLAVPLAHADEDDDLRDRQREVKGRIADAASDLHEASQSVTRATATLQVTLDSLAAARRELVDTRARLVTARERDAQLQVELAEAERELEEATTAMEQAEAAATHQQDLARQTAISIYTQGDPRLAAIGSVLRSGSIEELGTTRIGTEVLTGRQETVLVELEELEAELTDERAEVARTTAAVEDKRVEAAEHLEAVQALYAEATAAKTRVQGLVVDARAGRQRAYAARARDRQVLSELRERESRIQQQLVELARRQRNQVGFTGQSDGYLSSPTSGSVTSPYGYRTHPIYGYYSLHNGTDFGTGCGAPLYASAAGTVIDTYYDSVYGNRLYLSLGKVNGRSLVLVYNHLSGYRASEGDRVPRGTVIGYSGTTGWSTGCHLHFTVLENGTAVDPMRYL